MLLTPSVLLLFAFVIALEGQGNSVKFERSKFKSRSKNVLPADLLEFEFFFFEFSFLNVRF